MGFTRVKLAKSASAATVLLAVLACGSKEAAKPQPRAANTGNSTVVLPNATKAPEENASAPVVGAVPDVVRGLPPSAAPVVVSGPVASIPVVHAAPAVPPVRAAPSVSAASLSGELGAAAQSVADGVSHELRKSAFNGFWQLYGVYRDGPVVSWHTLAKAPAEDKEAKIEDPNIVLHFKDGAVTVFSTTNGVELPYGEFSLTGDLSRSGEEAKPSIVANNGINFSVNMHYGIDSLKTQFMKTSLGRFAAFAKPTDELFWWKLDDGEADAHLRNSQNYQKTFKPKPFAAKSELEGYWYLGGLYKSAEKWISSLIYVPVAKQKPENKVENGWLHIRNGKANLYVAGKAKYQQYVPVETEVDDLILGESRTRVLSYWKSSENNKRRILSVSPLLNESGDLLYESYHYWSSRDAEDELSESEDFRRLNPELLNF